MLNSIITTNLKDVDPLTKGVLARRTQNDSRYFKSSEVTFGAMSHVRQIGHLFQKEDILIYHSG